MAVDLAALQALHPEWNLVDMKMAPNGGIWAVGADGGVFALDPEGGTTGTTAPYLGSAAGQDYFTDREATRIEVDPRGGYSLFSGADEQYHYPGQAPAPLPPPPTPAEVRATSPEGVSAKGTIAATLATYGLPASLADTLWNQWFVTEGRPVEQIFLDVQGTPEFKARFPGFDTLAKQGLAWTPGQYITYESSVFDTMKAAGLPAGFYDSHDDFGQFITAGWSVDEVNDAVTQAGAAVHTAPPEVLATLKRWGLTDGDLTAFWLNSDKAMPLIERKVAAAAAGVAGSATRVGFGAAFGELTQAEATGLSKAGQGTAEQFGAVAGLAPLFAETAGETMTGEELGKTEALGVVGGEAGATGAVERRRQRRRAAFEGGGGAAQGGAGTSGLGSTR